MRCRLVATTLCVALRKRGRRLRAEGRTILTVIPAKAGVQTCPENKGREARGFMLDPGSRRRLRLAPLSGVTTC